jgi:hypothetical protein
MRLWSLHPQYLDVKGLTAVWREGLLAQKVLQGGTRGYRYHPQLQRFLIQPHPVAAVAAYLFAVWVEAERRGYHFDRTKLAISIDVSSIPVTRGQIRYEWAHLLSKLFRRDLERYQELIGIVEPEPHPLFIIVNGDIEIWEAIRSGEGYN